MGAPAHAASTVGGRGDGKWQPGVGDCPHTLLAVVIADLLQTLLVANGLFVQGALLCAGGARTPARTPYVSPLFKTGWRGKPV